MYLYCQVESLNFHPALRILLDTENLYMHIVCIVDEYTTQKGRAVVSSFVIENVMQTRATNTPSR